MTDPRSGVAVPVPAGFRIGRWEVGEPIASGAFGSVYAARAVDGGAAGEPAEAALKFLPTGTRTPRQLHHLRDLAERELTLHRRCRQPRLIRMYEALTVDAPECPDLDGATVLVLERAESSLAALLSLVSLVAPGPLPGAGTLLVQICEGLAQLHGAGWVHGDLKPGNVLLMAQGAGSAAAAGSGAADAVAPDTVRLADFNLAAELEGTHAYSPAFSTPDYTPPELLWSEIGERGRLVRQSADIWAFGVLAHLVLTGTPPFPGGTPAARRDAVLSYAQGRGGLRLSPALPSPWREIVRDCLAPTHEERAAHDAPSLLRRTKEAAGTAAHAPAPRRRLRRAVAAGGAALLLMAASAGVTALLLGGASGAAQESKAPAGYDRCKKGHVCFFTESTGKGDMCSWFGFDEDWRTGTISCPWSGSTPPRSVFNNGVDGSYTAVSYYPGDDFRGRQGCISRLGRTDLPAGQEKLRSHRWVKSC
ncbi:protein kinase domain-containing protein [Streptomyces violens]|uniref:protein kinase domain-containing protein n=1 Tax=Streptomyces violens TaxID=66377 RepID=UPI0004C05473|nr:protein kinase [Streptomyces violens]